MTEVINENKNLKHEIDLEKRTQRENSLEGQAWITKNRTKKRIHANLSGTKYPLVQEVCMHMGFAIVKETDVNCYFIWNDSSVQMEKIVKLKSYQRINHFHGMGEICRKDSLARNMSRIKRIFPVDYNFVPNTWILPAENTLFDNYCKDLKNKKKIEIFIVKPSNGAMGNGIYLMKNDERVRVHGQMIVQDYIKKPMLVDGYKFDLRIYVLVTSCDPLRIFIYKNGLVRFSTECYNEPNDNNISDLFMHLTNYSVNKHSEKFSRDEDASKGSKRSLTFLNEWLRKNDYNVANIWSDITDVIVKTLIVSQPHLLHAYKLCRPGSHPSLPSVCFEILGFDILLDHKAKPWLLEVNRSPSFGTDSKLDYNIKSGLLRDTIKLLNIKSSDKLRGVMTEKIQSRRRLFSQPSRNDRNLSENVARRMDANKRKILLKEQLARIRRNSSRDYHEFRNLGQFERIYPPYHKEKLQYYDKLLDGAMKLFSSGKPITTPTKRSPFVNMKEEEVLDLLNECETNECTIFDNDKLSIKGPKPLSSMPSAKVDLNNTEDCDDFSIRVYRSRSVSSQHKRSRPTTALAPRKKSTVTPRNSRMIKSSVNLRESPTTNFEKNDELTRRTLMLLNEMKIKFPGKTEEEASYVLNQVRENWTYHKPKVAHYWLGKLDSVKRRKVIDIVKENVRSILHQIWGISDIDKLKLSRLFTKLFNRMLWRNGQGLWNCFTMFGNSWQTMFNKSSDSLSELEMSCCRQTVSLCKECLLVVYVFSTNESRHYRSEYNPLKTYT